MAAVPDLVSWWNALGRPLRALPRVWALAVLIGTVLALVWASAAVSDLAAHAANQSKPLASDRIGDVELYSRINNRVAQGEDYYTAALDEQRTHNYPARPFVTVRPPTMAWITSIIGAQGWRIFTGGLLLANALAWIAALSRKTPSPRWAKLERACFALLVTVFGIGALNEKVILIHELTAGLLVSLALALYRPGRWWPSLIAAALALAVRELALPFVLLWLVFALMQRRWKEAAAIGAVLAIFAAGMALHAQAVLAHNLPIDQASSGWNGMAGPQFFLLSLARGSALLFLPKAIAGPLALLSLLGWVGLGGRLGLFASLWFAGFALAMAIFARENNFYWALLTLPAYLAGLALVPRALADVFAAVRNGTIVRKS